MTEMIEPKTQAALAHWEILSESGAWTVGTGGHPIQMWTNSPKILKAKRSLISLFP